MVAKKHAAGSLPTLEQMSTWMQNHRRKRRDPSSKQVTAAGQEVAPTQIALEDWPRCGKALEDLYLLGPQVVSAAEVFVPFTCRGMLSRLSHYSEEFVNLAVDAKMKVLDRGAGVATVSLLVKDGLRCADVGAGAGRVQGRAFTTRAVPFLQATMHQETTANYVRLFRVAAELWEACHPSRPPLRECVRQLRKDFAPSIETARQEVFPNSRPCDDWFHFKSRCKKLELKGGRCCKVNADWLMACLEDVRLAPTLPVFSEAWGGMLKRLEAMDEGTVQAWLRSQYLASAAHVEASNFQCRRCVWHVARLWLGERKRRVVALGVAETACESWRQRQCSDQPENHARVIQEVGVLFSLARSR